MGLDSIPPFDDPKTTLLPPPNLAEARVADDDKLDKGAMSPEAEEAAFLEGLRRDRRERLKRDALIGLGVVSTLAAAIAVGWGAPVDAGRAAQAERAAIAPESAPTATEPLGPPAPPTIEGKLGKADVVAAVVRKEGQLKRCYQLGFDRDPKLSGQLTMKLLVGESGDVIGVADVGSSVGDRGVVRCVARSMRSLSLPAPSDGARALVTYPLVVPTPPGTPTGGR